MATDATGTPTTVLGLPKLNVGVDPPTGKGINAMMDAIDTAVVGKPSGIASGEVAVWNGSTWVRSTTTNIGPSSLGSGSPSGSNFLRGDGTWAAPTAATVIAPTHMGAFETGSTMAVVANQAYLFPLRDVVTTASFTRFMLRIGVSSGNLDLGVYYSDDESTFTRLTSTGSFASPGAGGQIKTITQFTITPVASRRWFIGFAADNATITVGRLGADIFPGRYLKATSFPLPSSLTGMTATTNDTIAVGIAV